LLTDKHYYYYFFFIANYVLIGTKFNSEVEAYKSYLDHAQLCGFSIRKSSSRKTKDGKRLLMNMYVCSKEGLKDAKRAEGKCYSKNATRTGCKAMVQFQINDALEWTLNRHDDVYNHRLVPSGQRHLMRSARIILKEDVEFLHKMVESGIGLTKAYRVLGSSLEEGDHLPYTLKDAQNAVGSLKLKQWDHGDVSFLLELLDEMKQKDPGFYYDHDKDGVGRMEKFFWRHSRMKRDYEVFGDLVIFDTTHKCTMYKVVCCPFTGINHHGQVFILLTDKYFFTDV